MGQRQSHRACADAGKETRARATAAGAKSVIAPAPIDLPTIFEKDGFKCFFYSNDHRPIHDHVRKGGGEAVFDVENAVELRESHGLKVAELSKAEQLAEQQRDLIIQHWHEHLDFDDEKQGNLFFSIADILDFHRPAAFVLENVKNLKGHDGGKTFDIIFRTLTEHLGYTVYHKVINARSVVPQHRERIFFVGFREWRYFEFPQFPADGPKLGSILEAEPLSKYTLTDHLWNYLQRYAEKHRAAGNGFAFGLATERDTARTLSARYHKDGSEILIAQSRGRNP